MTYGRANATLAFMAGAPWTDADNDRIVADYFAMLKQHLEGRPYTKAEHNRQLQGLIGRSRESIEFKHQNISAVLQIMGGVWIAGYKPRSNFQGSLGPAVERWLDLNPAFLDHPLVPRAATKLSDATALWIGPPPSLSDEPPHQDIEKVLPIARKIDFPGREARNRELGQAGEELVFEHERRLLTDAGHPELAKRVRWVSEEEGDGAGYDIASFSRAGGSRLIEVKTTNGWDRTPFYISPNELEVAEQRRDEWRLLRVWNFSREPKAFELRPPLEGHVTLAPTNFLASFR